MKGATARYLDLSLYNYHFNPRPREGSDAPILDKPEINIISIHAPVKGATREEQALIYDYEFQSTLPRRERHPQRPFDSSDHVISIHAPAKGATA